jgi:antagonist of KipI
LIVRVRKSGLLTTVQDRGRWGYQAMGVPVAGPMDMYSHRLANAMVGNAADAATLEVTLAGPELEFEDERDVAVTGAEFEQVSRQVFRVHAGKRVTFGARVRGARAYVAISGGIETPIVLGSRSTHLPSAMGGVDGRALKTGDELRLGARSATTAFVASAFRRTLTPTLTSETPAIVRVLPGPQRDRFTANALDALQSSPYRIGTDSNRMGYRLTGPRLEHTRGADIISDATPIGSLQVPASGQPILLMADRQTTGGYAKIATVISADIGVAGQLLPGDEIRFAVCTRAEALTALIAQEQTLMAAAGRR